MGWSLPDIQKKNERRKWSPWSCLLIIFLGIFLSLIFVVFDSQTSGLPSLTSGHWLPLILQTIIGCLAAITLYTFWWEIQAYGVWRWNSWRQNMNLLWYRRAHQHHFISFHSTLTSDPQLLPKIAGVASDDGDEKPSLTLLPEEPLTPGISRFEQLCYLLFSRIPRHLLQKYSGNLTVLLHTSSSDKEAEQRAFLRLWTNEKLPGFPNIFMINNDLSFKDWNQRVSVTRGYILVLAIHYRQPDESLPEFASVLLLTPPSLITQSERRTALRLFRAMPLRGDAIGNELKQWREMGQQPPDKNYLVWCSGLDIALRQGLGRFLNMLPLPLIDDIGAGGIIDFDKEFGTYGSLTGWLMIAAASEMTDYSPSTQLLLYETGSGGWAVTLGDSSPVIAPGLHVFSPIPFPAGSIMMALLLSFSAFGLIAHYYPSVAFSWSGITVFLVIWSVFLPAIAILVRHVIAYVLYPRFIKAARQSGKE